MPLLMAGPGLPAGTRSQALVANIDIAPTIAALAGVRLRSDGQSFLAFARNPRLRSRRPILLEGYAIPRLGVFHRHNTASVLDYFGVVAGRYKYVRYAYGERELYDLGADPAELHSLAADPRYRPVVRWAERLTSRLKECQYAGCRRQVAVPDGPAEQGVDWRESLSIVDGDLAWSRCHWAARTGRVVSSRAWLAVGCVEDDNQRR
jgi:N-acetylglucosamine-6-sulfatase